MASDEIASTPRSAAAAAQAEDAALTARLLVGDASALEMLHARYARPCLSLARRLLGDDGMAQEVVQEVFLVLWKRPQAYDPDRGAFASWLLATTHHKAVDAVRREQSLRNRRSTLDTLDEAAAALASPGLSVEDEVGGRLRGDRVRSALAQLPVVQREALVLAYFGSYTQREIAQLTDSPLGTVKTRMLAGMRRLRDVLADPHDTVDTGDTVPTVDLGPGDFGRSGWGAGS